MFAAVLAVDFRYETCPALHCTSHVVGLGKKPVTSTFILKPESQKGKVLSKSTGNGNSVLTGNGRAAFCVRCSRAPSSRVLLVVQTQLNSMSTRLKSPQRGRCAIGIEVLAGVHNASTRILKRYRRLVEPVLCSPAAIKLQRVSKPLSRPHPALHIREAGPFHHTAKRLLSQPRNSRPFRPLFGRVREKGGGSIY